MGRIRSNYVLQVHKVTSTRGEGFLFKKSSMRSKLSLSRRDVEFPRRDVKLTPLCHVATWDFTSRRHFLTLSVTSRRGPPMSRRHFLTLSVTSRRGISHRDVIFDMSLSRRDVASNVATWIKSTLCHVATLPPTSRRCLVKLSVTSRRDPARRCVALF